MHPLICIVKCCKVSENLVCYFPNSLQIGWCDIHVLDQSFFIIRKIAEEVDTSKLLKFGNIDNMCAQLFCGRIIFVFKPESDGFMTGFVLIMTAAKKYLGTINLF